MPQKPQRTGVTGRKFVVKKTVNKIPSMDIDNKSNDHSEDGVAIVARFDNTAE